MSVNKLTNSNLCEISYETIRLAMGEENYEMSLVGDDAEYVKKAVNQGIDSHLEACFVPKLGDKYEYVGHRLNCVVSPQSFPTLVRRLYEIDTKDSNDENPAMLADNMLYVLGINEYGKFVGREALGLE